MTEESLVSVIIPTYYRNEDLVDAIASVHNQSYPNVETIVVDDSGEGHAETVVDGMDVEYIQLESNMGAPAARTAGVKVAEGEYIQMLDDDDQLRPEKLNKQTKVLKANKEVGVVYSGFRWNDGSVALPDTDIRGNVIDPALAFKMAPCITSTMLIERDVITDIIPFADLPGADDIGFKIELALRTEFEFVDEALVIRRDSKSSRGQTWGSYKGRIALLEKYAEHYEHRPAAVRREAKAHTALQRAEIEMSRSIWSLQAILSAVRMVYYVPRPAYVGYLVCTLFGKPGYSLGRWLYAGAYRGSEARGKL